MGLSTLIQNPFHHVLANEIALNLKYRLGLKQIFNINLGIGIIKKTTFFVCIFDISPHVFTQILIGRACWMRNLPTQHTFDEPRYPKNKKYLKNVMMTNSLDAELNSASNELSRSEFE